MQRHADRLRRPAESISRGPFQRDMLLDRILEMRELRARQRADLDADPVIVDEQVMAGGERLDALREALEEIGLPRRKRLARHRLHERQHVLRAVVHLAHQEGDALLAAATFGDVAHHDDGASRGPHAIFAGGELDLLLRRDPARAAVRQRDARLDGESAVAVRRE